MSTKPLIAPTVETFTKKFRQLLPVEAATLLSLDAMGYQYGLNGEHIDGEMFTDDASFDVDQAQTLILDLPDGTAMRIFRAGHRRGTLARKQAEQEAKVAARKPRKAKGTNDAASNTADSNSAKRARSDRAQL